MKHYRYQLHTYVHNNTVTAFPPAHVATLSWDFNQHAQQDWWNFNLNAQQSDGISTSTHNHYSTSMQTTLWWHFHQHAQQHCDGISVSKSGRLVVLCPPLPGHIYYVPQFYHAINPSWELLGHLTWVATRAVLPSPTNIRTVLMFASLQCEVLGIIRWKTESVLLPLGKVLLLSSEFQLLRDLLCTKTKALHRLFLLIQGNSQQAQLPQQTKDKIQPTANFDDDDDDDSDDGDDNCPPVVCWKSQYAACSWCTEWRTNESN